MTFSKGDIVLTQFPFTDLSQVKLRPSVVLQSDLINNEVTICFISSQNVDNLTPGEFAIKDSDEEFAGTGLRVLSKVRVTRIVTLKHELIVRRLGKLGTQQIQLLNAAIIQAFQLM
ncbi:MAG: type II toxin-antitoxin system PemK/MazF family toxin [Calothrix sp. SM1_7_51]|nr:type II toxin-antitoxin system PemK/MazF family toxin [Calothrix sp. SM1_7_51]